LLRRVRADRPRSIRGAQVLAEIETPHLRLLRQVPAITELAQLDATGKERLRVSRLAMDVVGSGADLSNDPKFTEAAARKVYYGPVYFRRESEPYMTLAIAGTRRRHRGIGGEHPAAFDVLALLHQLGWGAGGAAAGGAHLRCCAGRD
jgi:hypothetical protein